MPLKKSPEKNNEKQLILNKAVKALQKRVCGYTTEERKTTYTVDADGARTVKDEVVICKEVGPDLAAIQFVLTNLDPVRWKQKPGEGEGFDEPEAGEAVDLKALSDAAMQELKKLCEE
jgi:hypothetical protein